MSVKADLGNRSFLIKSLLKIGMSHKGFYRMLGCIRHPLLVTQQDMHSSEPGNLVPLIDALPSKYSSIPHANYTEVLQLSARAMEEVMPLSFLLIFGLVWSLFPELQRCSSAEPSRAVSKLPEGWLGSSADCAGCCNGEKMTCVPKLWSSPLVISVDLIPVRVCVLWGAEWGCWHMQVPNWRGGCSGFGPADSSASRIPVLPGLPALCREDLAPGGASEHATWMSFVFSCWQEEHLWLNLEPSRFKGNLVASGSILRVHTLKAALPILH